MVKCSQLSREKRTVLSSDSNCSIQNVVGLGLYTQDINSSKSGRLFKDLCLLDFPSNCPICLWLHLVKQPRHVTTKCDSHRHGANAACYAGELFNTKVE